MACPSRPEEATLQQRLSRKEVARRSPKAVGPRPVGFVVSCVRLGQFLPSGLLGRGLAGLELQIPDFEPEVAEKVQGDFQGADHTTGGHRSPDP